MTHMPRVEWPSSSSTRSRISCAALLVKVMASSSPARARPVCTSQAMRWVSTRVLPEPAPARMSSGPSPWVTAARWGALRPSSRAAIRSSAAASGTTPEHTAARGGLRSGARRSAGATRLSRLNHRKDDRIRPPADPRPAARGKGQPCAHEWHGCSLFDAGGGVLLLAARPRRGRRSGLPSWRRPGHRALCTGSPRRAALRDRRRARGARSVRRAARAAQLARAAQGHSDDMVVRRFFDHVTPGGSTLGDRVAGDRLHARAGATGSSARRSPGPSSRSTRPTASCAPGWPAPATARSSSIARFRDVGIGVHARADGRLGRSGRHRRPRLRLPHRVAYAAAMALGDSVRAHGRQIAAEARSVRIDLDALEALDPGDPPELDPQRHYLEGPAADVADYLLVLDAINFGSGWFPTLRKRTGLLGLLHRRVEPRRPLARRRRLDRRAAARDALRRGGRDARPAPRPRAHGALRPGPARARALPRRAPRARRRRARRGGSAQRFAELLAGGMTMWQDIGFYKRAQIARERPRAGRRGAVRRHRRADDLRRQPRPPRPALRGRAGLRRRAWRRTSTPAGCCAPARRSARSAAARSTRARPSPSARA